MHAGVDTQVWFPEVVLLYECDLKKKSTGTPSPRCPRSSVCDVMCKNNKSVDVSTKADLKKKNSEQDLLPTKAWDI